MSDVLETLMASQPKVKTEVIGIRLSKDELTRLDKIAEATGRARATVAKALLLSKLAEVEAQL